jgi:hypothetical protein
MNPRASDREPGNLSVVISDSQLMATFPTQSTPQDLHVALLGAGLETRVERGENRNRTLGQEFVVLAHAVHASLTGRWQVPVPESTHTGAGRYAIAIWVSTADSPVPLQATGGWLPQ